MRETLMQTRIFLVAILSTDAYAAARFERKYILDNKFPTWLSFSDLMVRSKSKLSLGPECKSQSSCPDVYVFSNLKPLKPFQTIGAALPVVHVNLEFKLRKDSQPHEEHETYDGIFVPMSSRESQVLEENIDPQGCGDGTFAKVKYLKNLNGFVIIETVLDRFQCASDPIDFDLTTVAVAYKKNEKLEVTRFQYHNRVVGMHRFRNSDQGFWAYVENAKLEILIKDKCKQEESFCATLQVARHIDDIVSDKKEIKRISAMRISSNVTGQKSANLLANWSSPIIEFQSRSNFPEPVFKVDGPANFRKEPKGTILASIPDSDEVTFQNCQGKPPNRWVRVQWKGQDGWLALQNLRNFNKKMFCEEFD